MKEDEPPNTLALCNAHNHVLDKPRKLAVVSISPNIFVLTFYNCICSCYLCAKDPRVSAGAAVSPGVLWLALDIGCAPLHWASNQSEQRKVLVLRISYEACGPPFRITFRSGWACVLEKTRTLHVSVVWTWKGNRLYWRKAEWNSFREATRALTVASSLIHFDTSEELRLQCDVSSDGTEAVLFLLKRTIDWPVLLRLGKLSAADKTYSRLESAALGLAFGPRNVCDCLLGRGGPKVLWLPPCIVHLVTCHKPFLALLQPDRPGLPRGDCTW